MKLSISYLNGSSRIINLHTSFFTGNDVSWEERAMSIATDTGKPSRVILTRDDNEILNKRLVFVQTVSITPFVKVDEREAKKQLRKQFRNTPFTMTSKYTL